MDIYTESSGVDTSPDMNSSAEISPERLLNHHSHSNKLSVISVQPRKLTFGMSPEEKQNINSIQKEYMQTSLVVSPRKHPSISPPYRKVRALRYVKRF